MLEIDCALKRLYFLNRSTNNPWHWIFIVAYAVLTISSLLSNFSLIASLYQYNKHRNLKQTRLSNENYLIRPIKQSELTRDQLILYLSILDLLLTLTMPFTALDGLSKYWPVGSNTEILCKIAKSSPSTVVFSSSMLIVIIAVNCYRHIIHPHKNQLSPRSLQYIPLGVAIIASLFSAPQYYYTKLYHVTSEVTNLSSPPTTFAPSLSNMSALGSIQIKENEYVDKCKQYDENGWNNIVYCIEQWPFDEDGLDPNNRIYYTAFTFVFQLIIPFIIITFCYSSIYLILRKQTVKRNKILIFSNEEKLQKENYRAKRRNKLMVAISLVYLLSWVPLGLISLLLDAFPDILGTSSAYITTVFICCHIIGMCSTSINPIIYGYSNKHIRKGKLKKCTRYILNFIYFV